MPRIKNSRRLAKSIFGQQRANSAAADNQAEAEAVREKTERLKALRLAKEAADKGVAQATSSRSVE